jgi:aarF domain-containing kinase
MRISSYAIGILAATVTTASAFQTPKATIHRHEATKLYSTKERTRSPTVSELSKQMKDMQSQFIADNEDADMIMQALRGKNINDDDSQVEGVEMKLLDFDDVDESRAGGDGDVDRLPYEYDPIALQKFFKKRPNLIAARIAQVSSTGGKVLFNFAMDSLSGKLKNDPDHEVKRAAELRDTITSLGPFFIKLGQALSIRPDILSPRSMVELQKLCDKVPSYDSKIAFATIERELGRPVDEVFSEITPEPVAAASLGQVYKATLRATGEIVAVKVQRPQVLETVSLDLHLARELGLLVRNFPALSERLDAVALLDEFAFRFYQELDYNLESENGTKMKEQMKVLPDVVIPGNFPEYTARRVHVAEWIDGEKLSQSTEDDVGALVNLGVITYLTQLLDFGFFHADPHPGNMMRTNDGKLAILDFGLMTEVTDNQKYGMIEAIAHLLNRDYTEIGQDFINLDFIPEGTDTTPIVPALTNVFDAALAGGGAKSINFQELAADLAEITFEYPFKIPPYFALVIRAIGVLEGIALVGNPEFAIIDEAYPYIAKRLMTDDSPRLKAALRYMVYGREGSFDADKLIDLLQALEKFTAIKDEGDGSAFKVDGVRGSKDVGKAGDSSGSKVVVTEQTSSASKTSGLEGNLREDGQSEQDQKTAREALRFFFSPQGNVFREFILEEVVTFVDASGREASQEVMMALGLNNLPMPSLIRALSPIPSSEDKQMVQQMRKLAQFLLGDFDGALSTTGDGLQKNNQRLRELLPVIREYAPQLREFGSLLGVRLSEKALSRGLNWASSKLVRQ